ncbi:MAG: hypothetical protein JF567_06515 [Xanthomonadales bacterium]|nr:hypothetical protein [Xanthomonadales bacterium]
MTRWKLLCLGLAVIACNAAQADGPGKAWQGTLGPNEVVVKINAPDKGSADLEGRYFYRRHRMDIQLQGKASGNGRINLQEGLRDDEPHAAWQMQAPTRDHWDGEWIGPEGKRLPIHLHDITAGVSAREPGLQALRGDIDDYEWLRLSGLILQKKKLQQVDGYTLQWLHQPESGIDLFEVVSGYPEAQLQRVNGVLRKSLWNAISSYYDCMSGARDGQGEFETTTTLRHISPKILSASLFTSFYCGGAHPDFADAPLNIDPRDGREVDLDDVLWIGPGKALHEAKGNDWNQAWSDYRGKRLAPWVVAQFKSIYPKEFRAGDDECNYADPEVWQFPQWYATRRGIHLGASFARVARNCDDPDWAILPWKVIDAHPGAVRIH